jgi:hypothetical protein
MVLVGATEEIGGFLPAFSKSWASKSINFAFELAGSAVKASGFLRASVLFLVSSVVLDEAAAVAVPHAGYQLSSLPLVCPRIDFLNYFWGDACPVA